MKKIIFLFSVFILSACTPQVTVTSEVTVTLPTSTSVPTPTLHPDFVELQNSINVEDGFVLSNDGIIEYNGETVPNITVTADGRYVLVVGDDMILLESDEVTLDPEKGVIPDGYELENGEWVEAGNPLTSFVQIDFEKYNLEFDSEQFVITQNGENLVVNDTETGMLVYESLLDGSEGGFNIHWLREAIVEAGLVGGPSMDGTRENGQLYRNPGLVTPEVASYSAKLIAEFKKDFESQFGYSPFISGKNTQGGRMAPILVDEQSLIWAVAWGESTPETNNEGIFRYLVFESSDGSKGVEWIPIIPFSGDNIDNIFDLYP